MGIVSKFIPELGFAGLIVEAILFSLTTIVVVILFIAVRRWYRALYFNKLNERTLVVRSQWCDILTGKVPATSWRLNRLDCEIVESILLDSLELAALPEEIPPLLNCLRSSGLLDRRLFEARSAKGWDRRMALIALGRTRAPEVVAVLSEALDAADSETRITAVRALGLTELPRAAIPILERLVGRALTFPEHMIKNALVSCCHNDPATILPFFKESSGKTRQLLARTLAEMMTPELGEDLILLATDTDPEVRASAARAMGNSQPAFALPVLSVMVQDPEWFVRLRAVVALASINHNGRIRPLLRALCDPNRYVRQRAAWALAQMGSDLDRILTQVVETRDNYALQAFISELERSGAIDKLVDALQCNPDLDTARDILLQTLDTTRRNIAPQVQPLASSAGAR